MPDGNEKRMPDRVRRWRPKFFASFAWKSRVLFLAILALAIVPAGFAVVELNQAILAQRQSNAAHEVLEMHLNLAELGHRISHHVEHDGDLTDPEGKQLLNELNILASSLRKAIAGEVALRGASGLDEEGEELDRIDAIMANLYASINGPHNNKWVDLINEAVAHEMVEVDEIDAAEIDALTSTILVLTVSAIALLVLYSMALFWLDRSITIPLRVLRAATQQVAEGTKQVRITKMRDAEFASLAGNFNAMAAALDERHSVLEDSARALEQDVMDRNRDLQIANAELQKNAEQRKKFLTDISHELRTPLAVIRGDAEVTLRGKEKPVGDYKSALARIAEQVVGVTRLVDDLLYVARNEGGAPTLQLRPLDLLTVIQRVAGSMRAAVEDDGGRIAVLTQLKTARIPGDEHRMGQLLYILLDNAIHYSDGPPDIEIEILHATGGFALLVRDKGIGIADSDLPSIFERYQRGGNGKGKNGEGLGIGLLMARTIVEAHSGTITIDSILGNGTTVTVMLPAIEKLKVAHEHFGG